MQTASSYNHPQKFALLLAIASAVAYAIFILYFGQNIPIYDDFVDAIPFTLSYMEASGIGEKLDLIWSQYNQHRIVTNRLLYSFGLELSGQINFYFITLIGNLNVFFLALCYCWLTKRNPHFPFAAACISLLLFQLTYFQTALWPMTVVANYSVLSLALLCLVCLHVKHSKIAFSAAIISGAAATCTLASGQFVLLIGAIMIAIQLKQSGLSLKHWRFTAWILASAVIVYCFYQDYILRIPVVGVDTLIDMLISDPLRHLMSFTALVGSAIAYGQAIPAICLGATGLVLHCALLLKSKGQQLIISSFAFFLLITLAALATSRAWADLSTLIAVERYQFFSLNYWISLFILWLTTTNPATQKNAILMLFGTSFVIATYSYLSRFETASEYTQIKVNGMSHWLETGKGGKLMNPVFTDVPAAHNKLSELVDKGYYRPGR